MSQHKYVTSANERTQQRYDLKYDESKKNSPLKIKGHSK